MTTTTILVLLVTVASTIAFLPPQYPGARRRRDVASASKSGSFASSGSSSSSSGVGPGYSTSISSRSGFADSGQGLNSVNPGGVAYSGAGDFSYPNYGNQGGAGYMPADFHTLFMQYLDFMQRMSQQQAYAPNYYGPDQNNFDNTVAGGYNDAGAPGFSGIRSRSGGDDYGQGGFYFPGQGYGGTDSGDGHVSASASAGLSPRGGFGSASISPAPQGNPELATRMGSFPASGGGNFAVYSSSSSGSTDVNGVKKSFKEATSVVNDNGKVTTFHVRDP